MEINTLTPANVTSVRSPQMSKAARTAKASPPAAPQMQEQPPWQSCLPSLLSHVKLPRNPNLACQTHFIWTDFQIEAQIWHPFSEWAKWSFSPVTTVGILLAISVPLTGFSVPEHFESEEVEDVTETTHFLCIVFSFETVQYWPWKFPKNREALVLSVVDELTNADCQNPLYICYSTLHAGCKQKTSKIRVTLSRLHHVEPPPESWLLFWLWNMLLI